MLLFFWGVVDNHVLMLSFHVGKRGGAGAIWKGSLDIDSFSSVGYEAC